MGLWLIFLVIGCSWLSGPTIRCDEPQTVIARTPEQSLSCSDVVPALELVSVVAGRPLSGANERQLLAAIGEAWTGDSALWSAWLAKAETQREEFRALRGLEASKRRNELLYLWHTGQGLFGGKSLVAEEMWRHVAVRSVSDSDGVVLTEMDVEGWVYFASLCREVQGGTPLRLSVADKVTTYRMVEDKFQTTSTEQRFAMINVGPFWGEVRRLWQGATFEEQQDWIQFAPLPPPMSATSLGYFEAVLDTNAQLLTDSLHQRLGPFEMTGRL